MKLDKIQSVKLQFIILLKNSNYQHLLSICLKFMFFLAETPFMKSGQALRYNASPRNQETLFTKRASKVAFLVKVFLTF